MLTRMATNAVDPRAPQLPVSENNRFGNLNQSHWLPEWRSSGALPAQPDGNPTRSTDGDQAPYRNMRTGR